MRHNLLLQTFAVGLLVAVLYVTPVLTQWSTNPNFNNAICTATNYQYYPTIVSDGSGGAIITWGDYRSGSNYDIYAQRINASGVPQWTADGVAICAAAGHQGSPTIVSDGSGGAIITWEDQRSGDDIYAQRVNASGAVQWTANGVAICTATRNQSYPTIVSDGSGGAIITWEDQRSGSYWDIYAQRVNASGAVQWTADGVAICTATNHQQYPVIVSDGSSGAIITWRDARTGGIDIYAQRVNASGAVQWTTDGVAICTAPATQWLPTIVSDGSGGAIITWEDSRNGNYDIYAQRVNASGAVQWTADGAAICTATSDQDYPVIVSDGSAGAIITWYDYRSGNSDIYAQRVNASGAVQWTADGVAICTATGSQDDPTIVSDGSGGAIITWRDARTGGTDIYAQRVNASGAVQWTVTGAAICTATGSQESSTIVSDGSGGAIITWNDYRNGINNDIYAQKVDVYGYLGNVAPQIAGVMDVINDQGGKATVSWSPSYLDVYPNTTIKSYYVFRGVYQAMGMKNIKAPGEFLKEIASGRNPKNVLVKTPPSAQCMDAYYWEYIDSVRALRLPGYSYTMPTVSDSGPQGTAMCYAMVMARTSDELTYWFSIPDSGYSVDNLPPSAIASLSAQAEPGPSVNVHWDKDITDPDVGYYEIHRSTTDGFTPGPTTKIGQTSDTTLVDASPSPGTINYYRVVTVDIHGNKSIPSGQASAGVTVTNLYGVSNRWNLVSVPLTTSDYSKSGLYPTAVSNAFGYQGGYVVEATLANGVGYWLKFNGAQAVPMTGLVRSLDSIAVQAGWNLIGSISSPVAVAGLGSSPGGMLASQFFGYDAGYYTTDSIRPGKGYWVKVNQSGKLILTLSGGIVPMARIRILPDGEKPPAPPGKEVSNLTSEIPNEFALAQNYPNPFNPTTVISYQLPVASYVTLTVYNMLGQEVATLANGMQEAGYKSVEFDATGLPSGVYISKMTAGSFSQVRKMLLTK